MDTKNSQELSNILDFLRTAEQLKDTLRTAWSSNGRQESTAEHTWRLCLMVMLFADQFPAVDPLKLLKMCIIHDLGEAIHGDIPAVEQVARHDKAQQERRDLMTLVQPLPPQLQQDIVSLWDDYENVLSEEAKLAKAFDKLETLLQHTQGVNPAGIDYGFNLSYGKQYTDATELTAALRALIDKNTEQLARQ